MLVAALIIPPYILPARADGDANPDATEFIEPIVIEETLPNDPGELSVRLTTDYRRGAETERSGLLPNTQVFYGVMDRVGVSLSLPMAYARPDTAAHYGLGDASATLKILMLRPDPQLPALVAGVEADFPTGNRRLDLGDGIYALVPNLALLKDFGVLCVQGGFGWRQPLGVERRGEWTYGWAVSIPLVRNKRQWLTEIEGDWNRVCRASLAPGLKYNFTDRITLGVAVPIGLNHRTEDWGVVTQMQFSL